MSAFTRYISSITPHFCKPLVEGLTYTKLKTATEYIDAFIKYSVESKTNTNFRYLGFKEMTPKEELKFIFKTKTKITYDIAENDIALTKFLFQYGDEEEVREYYFYIPYASKGNIIRLSGKRLLAMPTLADKVISVGEKVIFINIVTAKYNFNRFHHPIFVDGDVQLASIIEAPLYKNQAKNVQDTTRAKTIIMHYLLASYGLTETLKMMKCPTVIPTYDREEKGFKTVGSIAQPPRTWLSEDRSLYVPSDIKFLVKEEDFTPDVQYFLGNVFYIIDHFPERITIDQLDDPLMWRRLMGEIIHSGNHGLAYLNEKMEAHFADLGSYFDPITIRKLRDVGVNESTLMGLLGVIYYNFNEWVLSDEPRPIHESKSYEVETFILNRITANITKLVLDINKEELRTPGGMLDKKSVDKICDRHFMTRCIFMLRKARPQVTSIDYSGDHLYFKNTAMVVQQESDPIDPNSKESNTSDRNRLTASMAVVGSILNLSKKNPTPLIRVNPYLEVSPDTGALSIKDDLVKIIKETDLLLNNTEESDFITDTSEIDNSLGDEEDDMSFDSIDDFEDSLDDSFDDDWN